MTREFFKVVRKLDGRLMGLFPNWEAAGVAIREDMIEMGPDIVYTVERVVADVKIESVEVGADAGEAVERG